jgi:hypothetical protein
LNGVPATIVDSCCGAVDAKSVEHEAHR